jgi:hypothetical protein
MPCCMSPWEAEGCDASFAPQTTSWTPREPLAPGRGIGLQPDRRALSGNGGPYMFLGRTSAGRGY